LPIARLRYTKAAQEGLAAIRAASLALGEGNPVAHLVTNIVASADADGDHAMARSKGLGVMASGAVGSVTYTDRLAQPARLAHRCAPDLTQTEPAHTLNFKWGPPSALHERQ
jgi:hypothetical protein